MNVGKEISLRRMLSSSASAPEAIARTERNCENVPSSWERTSMELNGYACIRRSDKLLPRSRTTSHNLGNLSYPKQVHIPHSMTMASMSNRDGSISIKVTSDWSYCRPPLKPPIANVARQSHSSSRSKNCTRRVQDSKNVGRGGWTCGEPHILPTKSLLDLDDTCIVEDISLSSCKSFVNYKQDLTDAGGDTASKNQHLLLDSDTKFSLTATSLSWQQQGAISNKKECLSEENNLEDCMSIENWRICPIPLSKGKRLSARKSHTLIHESENKGPPVSMSVQCNSSSSCNTLTPYSSSTSGATSNSISRMPQLPQYTSKSSSLNPLITDKAMKNADARDDSECDLDTQAERLCLPHDLVNTQDKITQVALRFWLANWDATLCLDYHGTSKIPKILQMSNICINVVKSRKCP